MAGLFKYEALDGRGKLRRGTREGDSAAAVRQWLREQCWSPVRVEPVAERRVVARWRRRLSLTTLALFVRQLATLLEAGTPVADALALLMRQQQARAQQQLAAAVRSRLQEGYSLAQALRQCGWAVPEELVAAVRAGEESGHLDAVLSRMADALEQREQLHRKVQAALIYPSLMVLVALGVVAFLMSFVVPRIVGVFDSLDASLPPLTQGLIGVSGFVQAHAGALVMMVLGLVGGLALLWRNPRGRVLLQRLLLRIPLVRTLMVERASARWARILGTLLEAGVPADTAIRIANETVALLPLRPRLQRMTEQVVRGGSLSRAMEETGFFPPLLVHLAASGEHNGRLAAMLLKGASRFEQQLARTTETLVALLEPAMIIIMGAVVLTIVLAVMLPIFSMNQMVGQ